MQKIKVDIIVDVRHNADKGLDVDRYYHGGERANIFVNYFGTNEDYQPLLECQTPIAMSILLGMYKHDRLLS